MQARNPAKDMPIGIIGATSICTVLYIIMCIVICMMVPYAEIDVNAPFSTAFGQVHMQWAKCARWPLLSPCQCAAFSQHSMCCLCVAVCCSI